MNVGPTFSALERRLADLVERRYLALKPGETLRLRASELATVLSTTPDQIRQSLKNLAPYAPGGRLVCEEDLN